MVEGHVSVRACGFESRPGHFTPTRVAKLVDAQSSGGCAFGRAGSSPVPGTVKALARPRLFFSYSRKPNPHVRIPMRNWTNSPQLECIFDTWLPTTPSAHRTTSPSPEYKGPFSSAVPAVLNRSNKFWTLHVHCSNLVFTCLERGFGSHVRGPMHLKASGSLPCNGLKPRGEKPAYRWPPKWPTPNTWKPV